MILLSRLLVGFCFGVIGIGALVIGGMLVFDPILAAIRVEESAGGLLFYRQVLPLYIAAMGFGLVFISWCGGGPARAFDWFMAGAGAIYVVVAALWFAFGGSVAVYSVSETRLGIVFGALGMPSLIIAGQLFFNGQYPYHTEALKRQLAMAE